MSDEPFTPRLESPRLRLLHFFVLFAVTAVVLAVSRSMIERINAASGIRMEEPGIASWTIGAIVLGGQITISAFAIMWRWRRAIEQIEPGEWLALIAAIDASISLLWWTLFLPLDGGLASNSFRWLNGVLLGLRLLWSVLLVLLLARSHENRPWKTVYAILLFGQVVPLLLNFVQYLTSGPSYFTFINSYGQFVNYIRYVQWLSIPAICAGLVVDRRQKRERRWTHWIGAGLYLVEIVLPIVVMLWTTYGASAGGGWSSSPPATP